MEKGYFLGKEKSQPRVSATGFKVGLKII